MSKHLNRKIGTHEFENLIADTTPPIKAASGVVAKVTTACTLKRGTVLGKDENGKLAIYDGTGTVDCVLADDCEIDAIADVNVAVYVMGCFNESALIVADNYALTFKDKDKLRERGIYLGMIQE